MEEKRESRNSIQSRFFLFSCNRISWLSLLPVVTAAFLLIKPYPGLLSPFYLLISTCCLEIEIENTHPKRTDAAPSMSVGLRRWSPRQARLAPVGGTELSIWHVTVTCDGLL
ncbi:uncharacterized protein BO88DRAFT_54679 [Aspergillus vadensis CBS 113365]|uniref:Uncharacterized protein n=1 Tax=Aspergillus vadensis (strain CBS 113365 / IMI 142717 / IBT 24658) TaxID=1448311 RepID=A0A319CKX6_ASPVC|nr:hypothetical protein BO88DRAFT_54679 [Aspergillus vadensis CBS 113365]PYH68952.1 hypothetical protein BO88DRAFT_54679 [Aspergillus vadensis CBS 113365]